MMVTSDDGRIHSPVRFTLNGESVKSTEDNSLDSLLITKPISQSMILQSFNEAFKFSSNVQLTQTLRLAACSEGGD